VSTVKEECTNNWRDEGKTDDGKNSNFSVHFGNPQRKVGCLYMTESFPSMCRLAWSDIDLFPSNQCVFEI
jgi:hypothetical protein